MTRPLVAITTRRLVAGRVRAWRAPGVGELADYSDSVVRAGADAALVPAREATEADVHQLLGRVDAVVMTGGPDVDPRRYDEEPHPSVYGLDPVVDHFESLLALAAIERNLPVLAICRGLQVLNVALGGSLHQHLPDHPAIDEHGVPGIGAEPVLHPVEIEPGSVVAVAMGALRPVCSSHHHQAADRLGAGLRVTAVAADGIVEAVELEGAANVLAVQWHPEETAATDPAQQALFDRLVRLAAGTAG